MSDLEHLDCEALLDLLKIKSRSARRIEDELGKLNQRKYQLDREREEKQQEVRDVLRELEAKAAQ